MKKLIRLTESDLHKIVKECVDNILKENYPIGVKKMPISTEQLLQYCKKVYTPQDYISSIRDCLGDEWVKEYTMDKAQFIHEYEMELSTFVECITKESFEPLYNQIFPNGKFNVENLKNGINNYVEGSLLSDDTDYYE
jgi:hypothetical protein